MPKLSKLLFLITFVFQVQAKTLIITDSHGEGAFGGELVSLIENQGDNVSAYAVGGSTAHDWSDGLNQIWGYWEYHTGTRSIRSQKPTTPKLAALLAKHSPSRVIIELGTNLIWRDLSALDTDKIEELLSLVNNTGAECIWVGPPDLRPKSEAQKRREIEIQHLLETLVTAEKCELIKSWEVILYPEVGGDGIHYDQIPSIGTTLAKSWARAVFERL